MRTIPQHLTICFPLRFTGYKTGTCWYPKSAGHISIYLADISRLSKGDTAEIIRNINLTLLEELSHIYSRTPNGHVNYDSVLAEIAAL
ncbi:MAG: hypothetical protein NWF09_07715 [Candidatus Bathyarchaeota archaeon]|nr:hypothetical protein [Candidatus Bathyarchaeota archaeon]